MKKTIGRALSGKLTRITLGKFIERHASRELTPHL